MLSCLPPSVSSLPSETRLGSSPVPSRSLDLRRCSLKVRKCMNEYVEMTEASNEAHTHCLLFVLHGSHKVAGLPRARTHRLCPPFQEQASHGRLISQAELTPVLGTRRRGACQLGPGSLHGLDPPLSGPPAPPTHGHVIGREKSRWRTHHGNNREVIKGVNAAGIGGPGELRS